MAGGSSVIGALRVDLSANTAGFDQGLAAAAKRAASFQTAIVGAMTQVAEVFAVALGSRVIGQYLTGEDGGEGRDPR
jgi:hypothetical protein